MNITPYPRRIRPELSDEIMRLYMRDNFSFEGDPQETSAKEEERERAIAEEYNKTHPSITLKKVLWSLEQQMQLWEDSAIKTGECLFTIRAHETQIRYLEALKQIAGGKISEELAAAYILAYEEDLRNG
ncbi:MAG: hypothetical protein LBG57_13615 [Treponema sp.]|jgi:hypothetical protein|nr:hypothetical protein [Treponema sp.]